VVVALPLLIIIIGEDVFLVLVPLATFGFKGLAANPKAQRAAQHGDAAEEAEREELAVLVLELGRGGEDAAGDEGAYRAAGGGQCLRNPIELAERRMIRRGVCNLQCQ
jgi:hypothetical protein